MSSIRIVDGIEIPLNATTFLAAFFVLSTVVGMGRGAIGGQGTGAGEAPQCYKAFQIKLGPNPGTEFLPDDAFDEALGPHVEEARARVLDAEAACSVKSCEGEAKEAYERALSSYLMERMQRSTMMEQRYGKPGLDIALKVYSSYDDKDIEKGIIQRAAAGQRVVNPILWDLKEVLPILTKRGRDSFVPCRTPGREDA